MVFRRLVVAAAALAIALAWAPAALADDFQDLFREYQKTGKVDGCKHSAKKLSKASREVPNDIEQYAPDFPAALEAASAKRASGKCSKKSSTGAATPTGGTDAGTTGGTDAAGAVTPPSSTGGPSGATGPTGVTGTTGVTPAPAPDPTAAAPVADNAIPAAATSTGGADDAPAPLLLLLIVGGLMLTAGLGWALAQWTAWEPGWALRARHASAEAGWRASAAWAEFRDWVRLGR